MRICVSSTIDRTAAPPLATCSRKRIAAVAAGSRRAASVTANERSGIEPAGPAAHGPATPIAGRLARREVRHARVDRLAALDVDARRARGGRPPVRVVAGLLLVVAGRVALEDAGLVRRRVGLHVALAHALSFALSRPAPRARRSRPS